MGEVIQFRPKTKDRSFNRVEALMKGQLETYVCDNCGEEFEVAFGNKPKRCPGCDFEIDWGEE